MFEWYWGWRVSNANEKYFHGKIPTWNNFVSTAATMILEASRRRLHAERSDRTQPERGGCGIRKILRTNDDLRAARKGGQKNTTSSSSARESRGLGAWSGQVTRYIRFTATPGSTSAKNEAPWLPMAARQGHYCERATTFQTGSDVWTSFEPWPPKEAQTKHLYFRADGKLSFDAPKTDARTPLTVT